MKTTKSKTYIENNYGDATECESLGIAKEHLRQQYPDAVFGDKEGPQQSWDGTMEEWRVLVWANESDAEDDAGAKAVAAIVRR